MPARCRPQVAAPPRPTPPDRRPGRAARSRRRRAARARPGVSAVTSGVPHASAWNALFGITRLAFAEVPKTPSAQPARWISSGSSSYSTHSTHSTFGGARVISSSSWPLPTMRNGSSGTSRAAARMVSRPCSGISLPTNRAWKSSAGCHPGRKSRSSAPTKQTASRSGSSSPSSAKCRAFCAVSATTRSARRSARRSTWRRTPARGRAGREPAAVLDQRVVEGDERVEDHRPSARDPLGRGDVEVAGVADDDRVEALAPPAEEQARLGDPDPHRGGEPERPLVPPPLPDLRVPLDHLDAGTAKAGDHLRVPRVVALVRAEVEDAQAQRRISSTCCSRWRPPVRSSWWLATSSLTRPSETSWTPTTTSSTPSVSSGRWPIASPVSFSTVR